MVISKEKYKIYQVDLPQKEDTMTERQNFRVINALATCTSGGSKLKVERGPKKKITVNFFDKGKMF